MPPPISVDVRDVSNPVAFYEKVFSVKPQKQVADYAKFDLKAPALNFSLVSSKQLGISLSGIKSRVPRGRKQLKRMLDDYCLIEFNESGGVIDYRTRSTDCDGCAPNNFCAADKS